MKLDFNLLKRRNKVEKCRNEKEVFFARVACLHFALSNSSVSGILAFMREIIGHFFLIFQNFSVFAAEQFSIIWDNIWKKLLRRSTLASADPMLSAMVYTALTIINGIRRRKGENASRLHGNSTFLNLSLDLHNKSAKAHFCHAMFAQYSGSSPKNLLNPYLGDPRNSCFNSLTFGVITFRK